jgi:hypothetical protein
MRAPQNFQMTSKQVNACRQDGLTWKSSSHITHLRKKLSDQNPSEGNHIIKYKMDSYYKLRTSHIIFGINSNANHAVLWNDVTFTSFGSHRHHSLLLYASCRFNCQPKYSLYNWPSLKRFLWEVLAFFLEAIDDYSNRLLVPFLDWTSIDRSVW